MPFLFHFPRNKTLGTKTDLIEQSRLAKESSKLDPREEQAMAEEGFKRDSESWPKYR